MINKNTIKNMKKQIKVDNLLIENTKNKIFQEKQRFTLNPLIKLTTFVMMSVLIIAIISINVNDQKKISLNSLVISVYAMESDNYYLTTNYQKETNKQILKPNIKIKLARYNKAMSSVPGIPIAFDFNYGNQANTDYIKISINNGDILTWDITTGIVNNLGDNYSLQNNGILYFNPSSDTIITVVGIKNNIEVFKKNIKIILDTEYNYYANIDN
ncbi:MAG: hypothetical protein PHU45_04170 [Bacilli bacterium]|nr:hypothetical protein [Bacilli bacterium]